MNKIAITSDCTCDLSDKILEEYGVKLIYFYMQIDYGCFKDSSEITASNVVEYLENGGRKMVTVPPDVEEIYQFYQCMLEKYDEIIHISISSKLSEAFSYAARAAERFDGKVHVIDSGQLSTGMGHLIVKAAEMVKENKSAVEIVNMLEQMKQKVVTTFIMDNLECFYRTGMVNKMTNYICALCKIHPVIQMKKGKMALKGIRIGHYESSAIRYVRNALRKVSTIDKKRIFITHPDCKLSLISKIRQQVASKCNFETVYVTRASATVTGNCGSNTVGVLYVRK